MALTTRAPHDSVRQDGRRCRRVAGRSKYGHWILPGAAILTALESNVQAIPASACFALTRAASRASGPKSIFSAWIKVTSVSPAKPKKHSQIGFLKIHHLGRALGIEAAKRLDDDFALARDQPPRARFRVAECLAGSQHMVEPGPQPGRDAEVVHRRADDGRICGAPFGDHLIRKSAGTGIQRRAYRSASCASSLSDSSMSFSFIGSKSRAGDWPADRRRASSAVILFTRA